MVEILLIACGLALDAFSLAVSYGMCHAKSKLSSKIRISLSFGFFQMFMPILGFWLGKGISRFVNRFDHWIVFLILAIVGTKMISDGVNQDESKEKVDISKGVPLLLASLATSIDAFAVGISFALLKKGYLFPAIIIGIVTTALSFFGVSFGSHVGKNWIKRPELIGGAAIIAIGVKSLIQGL
jgi:putative Mn2+ efflux pump MntP